MCESVLRRKGSIEAAARGDNEVMAEGHSLVFGLRGLSRGW